MKMRIVIPTRGRVGKQLTAQSLPRELRRCTTIVCPKREVFGLTGAGMEDFEVIAQPDPEWKIYQKRVWILQEFARLGYERILMLDDDLRFSTRISETDWHLKEIRGKDLIPEFERIDEKLGPEFPHVGFGQRQGNNQLEEVGWQSPGKMCYALGYYLPIVLEKCVLGRVEIREDMELSLQLLLKGHPNAVWQTTVVDQRKYDAPGGASNERSIELSNNEAKKLAAMYPAYVSTTERKYKASVPRIEVIVQWKKALTDGLRSPA